MQKRYKPAQVRAQGPHRASSLEHRVDHAFPGARAGGRQPLRPAVFRVLLKRDFPALQLPHSPLVQ